tara:strand:+ start:200 stop:316 length:117 start_codon:yes stop_codon:yes gene_type:complete
MLKAVEVVPVEAVVGNQMGKVVEAGEVKEGMDFYREIL